MSVKFRILPLLIRQLITYNLNKMSKKNNANASGFVNLRVQLSDRISAEQWRDNDQFIDWIVDQIATYNFKDMEVIKEEITLDDFTYIEND